MNRKRQNRLKLRAGILKALAHPTRLLIVEELAESERCVRDLQHLIGTDMSTVSRHLAVLKNAGLLGDDKRGLQVFYHLRLPCVMRFFDCIEAVVRENVREQMAR